MKRSVKWNFTHTCGNVESPVEETRVELWHRHTLVGQGITAIVGLLFDAGHVRNDALVKFAHHGIFKVITAFDLTIDIVPTRVQTDHVREAFGIEHARSQGLGTFLQQTREYFFRLCRFGRCHDRTSEPATG
jgi:hypothetical protein